MEHLPSHAERDIVTNYLSRNIDGPYLATTEQEKIFPILNKLYSSASEVERLERLDETLRMASGYEASLESARAEGAEAMKATEQDSMKKNKMLPAIKNLDTRKVLMMAMQFKDHFLGGCLFQTSFWADAFKGYANVSICLSYYCTLI